jgi:hypothetical protein
MLLQITTSSDKNSTLTVSHSRETLLNGLKSEKPSSHKSPVFFVFWNDQKLRLLR